MSFPLKLPEHILPSFDKLLLLSEIKPWRKSDFQSKTIEIRQFSAILGKTSSTFKMVLPLKEMVVPYLTYSR